MPLAKKKPGPHIIGDRVIYEEYLRQKKDSSATAKALELANPVNTSCPSRKQVAAAVQRMLNNTSAEYWTKKKKASSGRLPVLDDTGLQILRDEARAAKEENRIIRLSKPDAHAAIMRERLLMMVRLGRESSLETFDPKKYAVCERKLDEYVDKIWPEQRKSKPVTDAREKAKAEPRNAISCAAVAGSVFERTNPDCILTSDHMACFIDKNSTMQITVAAEGSQASMRKQGLSIGYQQDPDLDDEGNVKLPCHCSMMMSGKRVAVIAEIWDDQISVSDDGSKVCIYALDGDNPNDFYSATCFSCYIAFGTPHELVMYEMYTKVIIPKAARMRDMAKALAGQRDRGRAFDSAPSVVPVHTASASAKRHCASQVLPHSVKGSSVKAKVTAATSREPSDSSEPSFAVPELNPVFQQLAGGCALEFLSRSPSFAPRRSVAAVPSAPSVASTSCS